MNEALRDNLWELFPDLIIYDEPVLDSSIIGLALLYDKDFSWVVVYDENSVINSLAEQFMSDSEDPETDAVEYYNFNILGGYLGFATPLFFNDFEDNECVASRCSNYYESYITLDRVSSISDAFEVVRDEKTFLFVPLEDIEKIKEKV